MSCETRNAIITSTFLGVEDHGIFTCILYTQSGALQQGFGSHNLKYKEYGITYLRRILSVLKVEKWEDLPGTHLRIHGTSGKIEKIGHIIEDEWFAPEKELANA